MELLQQNMDDARPASPTSSEAERTRRERLLDAPIEEKPVEMFLSEYALHAGCPIEVAKQALDTFCDFVTRKPRPDLAKSKDSILHGTPFDAQTALGSMDNQAFGRACVRIADVPDLNHLPEGFLESAMKSADKNGSGDIDFFEFLYFYYKFSFSEEVLVRPEERILRVAARKFDISYEEIGQYKKIYDQIDEDKSDSIEYDEFEVLVRKILKLKEHEELPEKRCKDMWREACKNEPPGAESIGFLSFVSWYKSYFASDHGDSESPFETMYKNVRRVCAAQYSHS